MRGDYLVSRQIINALWLQRREFEKSDDASSCSVMCRVVGRRRERFCG